MASFSLKVTTPEKIFFDGETSQIIVRTTEGDIGILANHTSLVADLPSGPLKVRQEDGSILLKTTQGERAYDGVFIFRPAVAPDSLLPGLDLDGAFIRVDRRMASNLPRVYACGDCTGHPLQIAKAVGEGNIAAISAAEDLQRQS